MLYNNGISRETESIFRHRVKEGATFTGLDASLLIVPGVVPFLPTSGKKGVRNLKKKIIIGITFIVFVGIFNLLFVEDESLQTETSSIEVNQETPTPTMSRKFTTISGIDNDSESQTFGELMVPTINIWENAGPNRGMVIATIDHNTKVEIVEETTTDQQYYKVITPENFEGWISELFITDIIEE